MTKEFWLRLIFAGLLLSAFSFQVYSQNCKPKPVIFPAGSNTATAAGTTSRQCNEHLIKVKKDQRLQIKVSSPGRDVYFALIQADATEEERGGDWVCEDCQTMNAYFNDPVDWELNIYDEDDKPFRYTLTVTLTDSQIIQKGVLNGTAVSLPKPPTPEEARTAGVKGRVTVKIEIGEEGEVYQAEAVSGDDLLRWAAEDAAMMARFTPTVVNGKPVRVAGILLYEFK